MTERERCPVTPMRLRQELTAQGNNVGGARLEYLLGVLGFDQRTYGYCRAAGFSAYPGSILDLMAGPDAHR